jgi:putative CocE/NonD family hydrolase
MRDGVELALDLLRPDVPEPLPVVLMRTPYDKINARAGGPRALPECLAQRGYIVAVCDCRGRFNSDGAFRPNFDEAEDGYDTVEWISAQPWCNGNVGMLGGSYLGDTQWYAASRRPPHLKAIVPISAQPGSLWRNEPLFNGCLMLPHAEWMVLMGRRSFQVTDYRSLWTTEKDYFEALPLSKLAERAGVHSAWWDEWLEHPTYDGYWKQGEKNSHADMDVAALNITGWWDSNAPGAPLNFEAMHSSPAAAARKLIIGPWPHWVNRRRSLSGLDFGEHAVIELDDYIIRFYDRWLKGIRNGIDDEKPVYIFVTGANEWWAEEDWPLPDTEYLSMYFHSHGNANSLKGDGALSTDPPEAEPADTYRYDPLDPVRVLWSLQEGPVDDRIPTTRDDCLCYTSEPLAEPLDVVGWVTCRLYAASSATDTDWHARLVDVHPDGSARFLCRGALRARFHESLEESKLLRPGIPTLFEFTMDACGVRFLPGHRIRVEISSSWFNLWDRNTNSGAENLWKDGTIVVANQYVHHERGLASCVILPIVRRG